MRTFIKRSLAMLLLLAAALLLCACGGKESADHPVSSESAETLANDTASAYKRAQDHLTRNEYALASEAFAALGSYEDSSMLAMYSRSCAAAEAGDYQTAITALESMGSYKDCAMRATYYKARALEAAASDDEWPAMMEAQAIYCSIPLFLDSQERIAALDGRIEEALSLFADRFSVHTDQMEATIARRDAVEDAHNSTLTQLKEENQALTETLCEAEEALAEAALTMEERSAQVERLTADIAALRAQNAANQATLSTMQAELDAYHHAQAAVDDVMAAVNASLDSLSSSNPAFPASTEGEAAADEPDITQQP